MTNMTINHVAPKAPLEAEVVFEVFGNKLLGAETRVQNLRDLIGSYLNVEEQAVIQAYNRFYNCPIPVRFQMHEEGCYRPLLDAPFRGSERHEYLLKALFERSLRSGPFRAVGRWVEGGTCGFVYPMETDAMAYAMRNVTGKTVVELAGASGILSIILAFAGARQVWMNEINKEEVGNFRDFRYQCPPDLQKRLASIHADCLELTKISPQLAQQADFVLCRNLIHFFNDARMQLFFKMLHEIMKPGAEAVFVANGVYQMVDQQVVEHNPDASCFNNVICCLYDNPESLSAAELIFKRFIPCSGTQITHERSTHYIYSRDPQGKWQVRNDVFRRLDKSVRPAIQDAVKANQPKMKKMKEVTVEVGYLRLFTPRTLAHLFEQNSFVVNGTFIADVHGNRVTHDFYKDGQRVGVIVSKKAS